VLYYADTLFRDAGVPAIASVGISAFKLMATLSAAVYVDLYGRRLLLFVGCSMMLLALVGLGTAFSFPYSSASDCEAHHSNAACPSTCSWSSGAGADGADGSCGSTGLDGQKTFILVSLFIYIGGYQVGFGPVVWLIISEVFPLLVRGKAVAAAVVTNFFFNALMTLLFPVELSAIGPGLSFFLYAALLCYAFYFVSIYVPETRGLGLTQIEEEFRRRAEGEKTSVVSVLHDLHDLHGKLEGDDGAGAGAGAGSGAGTVWAGAGGRGTYAKVGWVEGVGNTGRKGSITGITGMGLGMGMPMVVTPTPDSDDEESGGGYQYTDADAGSEVEDEKSNTPY
jgi:hypothetical protein